MAILVGQKVQVATTTVQVFDNTSNANLTNTTYAAGTPEVGVTFVAPASGAVVLTIGGGLRNNAANTDQVFVSPQIYLGTSSAGTLFLAPDALRYGFSSRTGYANDDHQYLCRTSHVTGLTAGSTYYVRAMHVTTSGSTTADIAAREITVAPAT